MVLPIFRFNRRCLAFTLFLAFALSAAGCTSLPNVRAVKSETPTLSTPRIKGPHGPLSTQQSRSIIASLKEQGQFTDGLEEHLTLIEAISGSTLVSGNRVTLLDNGPSAFDAMIESIRNAREYVHLETFIFDEDEVGKRFSDALTRKSEEGVEVCVIYDSYGSKDTSAEFWDRMREAGVKVLEFNPLNPFKEPLSWNPNHRDHRKILVVDGKTAFMGGFNITAVYLPDAVPKPSYGNTRLPWRDLHVKIEGPAAAEFQKLFLDTWSREDGPEISHTEHSPADAAGSVLVGVLGSAPGQMNRTTYMLLVSAISHAESSIHMISPYFVPSREMVRSLKEAVGRGVDVKIILPEMSDSEMTLYAGRYYYTRLLKAGVKLYEHHGGMLHAKTTVVDGIWATIGSTNLDLRSFMTNDEVNASILGGDFADALETVFSRELEDSEPVLLEKWRKRPMRERMHEFLSHLFARWL